MTGPILTQRQAENVVIQSPRQQGRVLSSHRHELQEFRRPLGWWVREVCALAALAGCVALLSLWVVP